MTFTANCTIVSHNPAGNYSQLDNRPVRDRNLSVEAKAVLWYLASNSDKWHLVMQNVAEVMNMGINRTRRAIAELRERGLVQGENLRNAAGKYIGWAYKIVLPEEFRDKPPETGHSEGLSSTRASSTPKQIPIIRPQSLVLKKRNKQDLIPSIPLEYKTCDDPWDEDEEVGSLIFSSEQKTQGSQLVTFGEFLPLEPEAVKIDCCPAIPVPEVTSTVPISGEGESSAVDYTYTTNDNQVTKPKLTGSEKRAAKRLAYSDKQSARREAARVVEGRAKGLWGSLAELNAFMDALIAHTVENLRIHTPDRWVESEIRKALNDGTSVHWHEFKSTGKVSQAHRRPVPSSNTSQPLYAPSQAQEFRDWYDWAKKAGLVDYSYSNSDHYAIVVMGDGLTLPWREAKARFPKC